MLPPRFSCLGVLKKDSKERKGVFGYGAITLYGAPFQGASPNQPLLEYSPSASPACILKYESGAPDAIFLQPSAKSGVWALPCSLAATKGIYLALRARPRNRRET